MARWLNRHNTYRELVTEHLDGVIDETGAATLRRHLESCSECATELREQSAVRNLLRAEPLVEVPRSFALPCAPRREAAQRASGIIGWAGGGMTAALRGMQVATASAALVLVALIALNVADTGPTRSPIAAPQPEAADAVVPESLSAAAPTLEPDDGGQSTEMAAAAGEEMAPGSLAPEPVVPPVADSTPMPIDEQSRVSQLPDDTSVPMAAPGLDVAPEVAPAGAPVESSRSTLDWALLALGAATAALALGVVALTWSLRRPA